MNWTIGTIAGLCALTALPALACPDWEAEPYSGQVDLHAGFTPDPYVRNVTAGGSTNMVNCFNGGFAGFVADRPDFDLFWSGSSSQLTIAVESNVDTILLINAPDGSWHYSDDYRGTNPAIVFNKPREGLYDVWVGSYDSANFAPGQLFITELGW
ncbi:MAG: peptidase S1 [Rhodobacteraceae bacterium]|nr:peptidase S1 [Paracoccaceae bacterium]